MKTQTVIGSSCYVPVIARSVATKQSIVPR